MQKKTLFNPRQMLVLAYLLAVVLWLVRCLACSAVMLNYKMQGKMPQGSRKVLFLPFACGQ